ncbi:PREDICTED: uncharacterized protein LOC104597731 [Nelumbo nucifera]|uniref:Uncharacterized protein n=2 Tax=Nelumbo nucifera TaxID=4432 RepID=A0A822Z223_NELNU|nr:PREDICTED: uncharacterized protein LOC104597731 [Nelumbo nucifera]DAD37519.1 TPA_asm: hypothetical protein HUJ06_008160 [Nelumbo nucifera]
MDMASVSSVESCWEPIVEKTEFEGMEVSEIDGDLLMSLLEESQVDQEAEDERLGCVIRSLEAEIDDPNVLGGCGSVVQPELAGRRGSCEDCRLQEMGLLEDGHHCSGSCASQLSNEFDWIDMDMASSTPSDDMGNWYMDSCADEMIVGMVELGEVRDYSQFYYGVPLEENAYSSLWQESYDALMF